jgi:hypothetical protein
MKAAWGEGYFPYLYQNHPDPNYDPVEDGKISWDLYRAMWGSHGEFIIDGNLKSVEYTDRLGILHVPTLIVVGDHDECDPTLSREMNTLIPGSKLTVLPKKRSCHLCGPERDVSSGGWILCKVDEMRIVEFGILLERDPGEGGRVRRLPDARKRVASNAQICRDFLTFAPQNLHVIVQI